MDVVTDPDSAALTRVRSQAIQILDIVEGAGMPVTSQAIAAADQIEKTLAAVLEKTGLLVNQKKTPAGK